MAMVICKLGYSIAQAQWPNRKVNVSVNIYMTGDTLD